MGTYFSIEMDSAFGESNNRLFWPQGQCKLHRNHSLPKSTYLSKIAVRVLSNQFLPSEMSIHPSWMRRQGMQWKSRKSRIKKARRRNGGRGGDTLEKFAVFLLGAAFGATLLDAFIKIVKRR